MKSGRRTTLAALALILAATAAACGGSSANVGKGAAAPSAPPADASESSDFSGRPSESDLAPPPPPPGAVGQDAPSAPSSRRSEVAPEPSARPGLGTEWGETRFSRISTVPFVRADFDAPFATATVFYNDAEGVRAMSHNVGLRRMGMFNVAGGAVSLGLRDDQGGFMSGFAADG